MGVDAANPWDSDRVRNELRMRNARRLRKWSLVLLAGVGVLHVGQLLAEQLF